MVSIRSQQNRENAEWNVEGIEASVSTSCKQTYQPQYASTYLYLKGKLICPQSHPGLHWLYHFQYVFLGYKQLQRFLSKLPSFVNSYLSRYSFTFFLDSNGLWLMVSLMKDPETIANLSSLCYQCPPWVHRGVLSNSLTSWQILSIPTNYLAFSFPS